MTTLASRRLEWTMPLITATALALGAAILAVPPSYTIVDLGVVHPDDDGSDAFGISPGGVVAGRSIGHDGGSEVAFMWTPAIGLVPLPSPVQPRAPFCLARAANDAGLVVGTGAVDLDGAKPLPVMWKGGVATALPLPEGESVGRARAVNSAGTIVGSVGSAGQVGAIFTPDAATIIRTTTIDGSYLQSANGINDAGRLVGLGVDPIHLAEDVGYVLETAADPPSQAFDLGSLPDGNGASCIGVSNGGHVVGGSNFDGGPDMPFLWTEADGMVAIPLPQRTECGVANAVNSAGWAVGTAQGGTAVPFLFDGTTTYTLAELLPPDSGWDLTDNDFSAASGISEGRVIVGTGSHRGAVRAFAMFPEPPTCEGDLNHDFLVDGADLGLLLTAWGPVVPGVTFDLNRDGIVNGADLGLLLAAWGACST